MRVSEKILDEVFAGSHDLSLPVPCACVMIQEMIMIVLGGPDHAEQFFILKSRQGCLKCLMIMMN